MRELLREQERSGMSLAAFAEAAGVPYTTIAWWRSKLRRGDEPRFVPVEVKDERRAAVEIAIGDVVVRVVDGDEAVVARLVRAIAAC